MIPAAILSECLNESTVCLNKKQKHYVSKQKHCVTKQKHYVSKQKHYASKQKHYVFPGADPYVIVECENEKLATATVKDSTTPEWNTGMIFYRGRPNKPIQIDVSMSYIEITDGRVVRAGISVT